MAQPTGPSIAPPSGGPVEPAASAARATPHQAPPPPSASASAAPWDPATAPTETVHRPDPGLARGVWEAPPWALWAGLGVVVVAVAGYLAVRSGVLKRRRAAAEADQAPKSRRRP